MNWNPRFLFCLSLMTACLLGHPAAWGAGRTMLLSPIGVLSSHGGKIGVNVCNTAGTSTAHGDSGVGAAIHSFHLRLQNLSALPQTVTVSVVTGLTKAIATHQDMTSSTKLFPAPGDAWPSVVLTVPPNDKANWNLGIACNAARCKVGTTTALNSPRMDNLHVNTADAICLDEALICIDLDTNLQLKITVAEDRGALLGYLYGHAHRCSGWDDNIFTPLPSYQINGGRPF